MAKREVWDNQKTFDLAEALKIEFPHAIGILDCTWQWGIRAHPDGDVTAMEVSPQTYAKWIRTDLDPDLIRRCLLACRWVDRLEDGRLFIHQWPDHCEDSVHLKLLRAGMLFADGTKPNSSRMSKKERAELMARFEIQRQTNDLRAAQQKSAQKAHGRRIIGALPIPLPYNLLLSRGSSKLFGTKRVPLEGVDYVTNLIDGHPYRMTPDGEYFDYSAWVESQEASSN